MKCFKWAAGVEGFWCIYRRSLSARCKRNLVQEVFVVKTSGAKAFWRKKFSLQEGLVQKCKRELVCKVSAVKGFRCKM